MRWDGDGHGSSMGEGVKTVGEFSSKDKTVLSLADDIHMLGDYISRSCNR